jgi:hypothetical protein
MAQMLMVAQAAMGVANAYRQGRAQMAQYEAQGMAHDYNEALLKQRAAESAVAFSLREDQMRRSNRYEAGRRAAWAAQSGTGMGGSNADVSLQQGANEELDALNIRYEGQLERRGLLAQASMEHWYGENARANRTHARRGILLNSASAILSGASRMYDASKKGG